MIWNDPRWHRLPTKHTGHASEPSLRPALQTSQASAPRPVLLPSSTQFYTKPARTQYGFISPTLLMNPYALLVIGGILLTTHLFAYFKGREHVQSDFDEYKLEVAVASAKAAALNEAKLADAVRNTGAIEKEYTHRMDALGRDYRSTLDGLRRGWRGCETLSRTAAATAGVNETSAQPASSPESFETACLKIERDAASDSLQMLHLQSWVRRVCK